MLLGELSLEMARQAGPNQPKRTHETISKTSPTTPLTSAAICRILKPPAMAPLPLEPSQPLQGGTVVFSGKLWSFCRKEARALVEELGGATNEEVTVRTSLLGVGAASYPDGTPDPSLLLDDTSTQSQKLRRVAQSDADSPGRIRVLSQDEFCCLAGQPAVAERRTQHYGRGLIQPAFKNNTDIFFGFPDLTTMSQMAGELQQGAAFRAALPRHCRWTRSRRQGSPSRPAQRPLWRATSPWPRCWTGPAGNAPSW